MEGTELLMHDIKQAPTVCPLSFRGVLGMLILAASGKRWGTPVQGSSLSQETLNY